MPKVLFATSEISPLIKTGGLADVCGNLPVALNKLRWTVRVLLPAYPAAVRQAADVKTISRLRIPGTPGVVSLLQGTIPQNNLQVWFVDYGPAFGRDGNPYLHPDGHDWPDNAERFALFARVAVEIALGKAGLRWLPDIVHCNDWQTGLIPALLHNEKQRPATLFTIHNLAYQGLFPATTLQALGLPAEWWSPEGLEFHGQLSFIKGGLMFADQLTTVSPNYALEIQTPEFGCGLDGLLRHRSKHLLGILNGIDDVEWNPEDDRHIAASYSSKTLARKQTNKRALLKRFALPAAGQKLLLGSIGRLAEQKGIDIVLDILPRLARLPVQLVLLGSGDTRLEKELRKAAEQYPQLLGVHIGYDDTLAHQIEAGADAFVMPSRFEPCGLNQMYSLRYGTLPIVHAVGGLKDTVVNATPAAIGKGSATGFCFTPLQPQTLLAAVQRAIDLYADPPIWQKLAVTAMQQSFNWQASAHRYSTLYRALLSDSKAART